MTFPPTVISVISRVRPGSLAGRAVVRQGRRRLVAALADAAREPQADHAERLGRQHRFEPSVAHANRALRPPRRPRSSGPAPLAETAGATCDTGLSARSGVCFGRDMSDELSSPLTKSGSSDSLRLRRFGRVI